MISAGIQATILVDNQAGRGLVSEHGLSLWIETEGSRILLDTGQGGALESNASALGIDLSNTDILVLSHGHYDHTGGLPLVTQEARHVSVYCHVAVKQQRYAIREGKPKSIGIPRPSLEALEGLPAQDIHWVHQPTMLSENIGLSGPIPRFASFEDTGGPFYLDSEGEYADPIEDDLALWIRTPQGLIVFLGCAHAGLVNTLNHITGQSRNQKVCAVIGGFHLMDASQERLSETISALRLLGLDSLVPCHCTGDKAISELRDALGELVSAGAVGKTLMF